MSLASDSSNDGFVASCLFMSWSLSSRLFYIKQTVVPSGLRSGVCARMCVCVLCAVLCELVSVYWMCV